MTDYRKSTNRRTVYRAVFAKFGAVAQRLKTMEELAELLTVLARVGTDREDRAALVDELADAIIVCEQMVYEHDTGMEEDVLKRIGEKVARLSGRVQGGQDRVR